MKKQSSVGSLRRISRRAPFPGTDVTALVFAVLTLFAGQQVLTGGPAPQTLWDLARLSQAPKAEWGESKDLIQEVYYTGEPFRGKPTRVFAYVGRPAGEGPFPGMVLVHGGGGRAFEDWARHWAKRGYVAIAMDTAGVGPGNKRLEDGGPDQADTTKFRNFTEAESREMWTYHAVSDVIIAHSLLRSLPEVDPERTGLTGISWGGYLTCITAGVDTRFKVAVPVYGCGFLQDNSVWRDNRLAAMEKDARRLWIRQFDPGQHIGRAACPILFLNGTSDFAYPLDSYRKTIEQVKPELATTAIHLQLKHGHFWEFEIVDAFVDSILRSGTRLAKVGEIRISGDTAIAPILTETPAASAELLYCIDEGPWQPREWKTLPGEIGNGVISAKLPEERPIAFLLQATDERGLKTSSTHANLIRPGGGENHAIIPTPKLEQDFYDWYVRHADVLRIKDEIDPEIVLIGDSITHMWSGRPREPGRAHGADSWVELFGERALNLGFGWDRTQNVLWRIDHGELDELHPKTVVIHIGTNNLAPTKNHVAGTPEQIAEGIQAVCERVQAKVPKAKILLMAVFPRGEQPDHPLRAKIAEINDLLPPITEKLGVELIDITRKLLNSDGTMSKEIAGDFLHPSANGYRVWADALRPYIE
ncbi:MAG: GDSL-type esterase/lipase family protein [Verrucomicrobia bacterium]|nr:GDSL-type esterase/lipase family protein [Verrucomicrobiota bacterium]